MAIDIRDSDGALEDRVADLLTEHANQHGVQFSRQDLCLAACDGDTFLGGLTGKQGPAWLMVELLAVTPEARKSGVGRALLTEAEARARAHGSTGVWLDTYSFQAPGFYEGLGYVEFGRIPNYTQGQDRIFYAKRFEE